MPTNAEYVVLIGEERIVSVINDGGNGVAVPKEDVTGGGQIQENHPDKGNRKIVMGLKIAPDQGGILVEDQQISIRVKVPDGLIRHNIQRFKFDLSNITPDTNNPLDFVPFAKIFPQNAAAVAANSYASYLAGLPPNEIDEENQTLVIGVGNDGGENLIILGLEIDFYHSISN
jgi:hypothetical protein